MKKVVEYLQANPAQVRAFILALLIIAAGFIPGLPVDHIDALVAAGLALLAPHAVIAVRNARSAGQDSTVNGSVAPSGVEYQDTATDGIDPSEAVDTPLP